MCDLYNSSFVVFGFAASTLSRGGHGHSGVHVEVVRVLHHPSSVRELIRLRLRANDATLVVTADHRIMVPRGQPPGMTPQTIPAGRLRVGDVVICADGEYELADVERWEQETQVYELSFKPDIPIQPFYNMGGNGILTKGTKRKVSTHLWHAFKKLLLEVF